MGFIFGYYDIISFVLLWDGFVAKVNWKQSAKYSWIWAGGVSLLNFISLYVLR